MVIEFKSRTFGYTQMKEDELAVLASDANLLLSLGEEKFPSLVDFSKSLIEAKTTEDEREIHDEAIEKELIQNRQTAVSIHRFCNYFLRVFNNEDFQGDRIEEIAEDLGQLGVKNQDAIIKLLDLIKQKIPWYQEYKLKKTYKRGLFPYLDSVGTTVELRGVFNREISGKETCEEYIEEVKIESNNSLLPVISVSITLDSGDPDKIIFQSSPDAIQLLIERLKAAVHKSEMLVEFSKGVK